MARVALRMTYADALRYNAAFDFIDAGTHREVEGRLITMAYRINSDALFAIARNGTLLKKHVDEIESFRKKLVMRLSDGEGEIPPEITDADGNKVRNEKYTEFLREYDDYVNRDIDEEISLIQIDVSDMNITGMKSASGGRTNDFPPSLIRTLAPIITGLPGEVDEQ